MSIKINSIVQEKTFKNNNIRLRSCNNNSINRENVLERNPQRDSVSFKGLTPVAFGEILKNINTTNSLSFAQKLIKKMYESRVCNFQMIAEVVKMQFPAVAVKSMQELAKVIPDSAKYRAYSSFELSPSFERIDLNMYLKLPDDRHEIPLFVSDASHEYTHLSQHFREVDDIEILKNVSGGNRSIAETLVAIYESTFSTLDTNALTYLPIVKRKDGFKVIDEHVKGIVSSFLEQISNEADPMHMQNVLEVYSNHSNLIFDVKRYCALKSRREKEAYATEYLISKVLGQNNSDVYKQTVEFFADLEDALGRSV